MYNSARFLFVYCWDDPWIAVVAEDLHKAARVLGCELYVLASGTSCTIDKNAYINADFFKANYFLSTFFKSLQYNQVDLHDLVDVECKLLEWDKARIHESKDEVRKKLEAWLAEAIIIMKIVQPDAAIIWNGMISKSAVYVAAARHLNIPVYHAEKGALPQSWYIDPKGINGQSSVASRNIGLDCERIEREAFQKILASIDSKGESAWDQPQRQNLQTIRQALLIKPSQKVIFFPGQVNTDTNILLFSKYFKNSQDALTWLVTELPNTDYFILAKPHPKGDLNIKDYEEIIAAKGRVLPEINVLDAIELADCVVSINSTIAFEATLRAKPVLLLGEGILSDQDYISKFVPREGASTQINACIERYAAHKTELHQRAISFATYLYNRYYTYRNDDIKTLRLIERLKDGIDAVGDKMLDQREIVAFFQEFPSAEIEKAFLRKATYKDIDRWFSGSLILKALWKKIKRRLLAD